MYEYSIDFLIMVHEQDMLCMYIYIYIAILAQAAHVGGRTLQRCAALVGVAGMHVAVDAGGG